VNSLVADKSLGSIGLISLSRSMSHFRLKNTKKKTFKFSYPQHAKITIFFKKKQKNFVGKITIKKTGKGIFILNFILSENSKKNLRLDRIEEYYFSYQI
jgi:hypothetical protein